MFNKGKKYSFLITNIQLINEGKQALSGNRTFYITEIFFSKVKIQVPKKYASVLKDHIFLKKERIIIFIYTSKFEI